MRKKHRRIWMAVLAAAAVIGIGVAVFYQIVDANFQRLTETEISNVDFTQFEDGIYTGSYSAFPISVKLQLTLKDHRITEIILMEHLNGQGKGAEVITDKIIETQSLEVDAVTGATFSSKVILKAVEDAFLGPDG